MRIRVVALKPFAGNEEYQNAIMALKDTARDVEGDDAFLYSMGVHVLLSAEGKPLAFIDTSSAPQMDICAGKITNGIFVEDESRDLGRAECAEYFRSLREPFRMYLEEKGDPIALEVLERI